MQLIYFPHTYITKTALSAMAGVFGKITVYQPSDRPMPGDMRQWQADGQLDVRYPVAEFASEIESLLQSYQAIGDLHQGRAREMQNYPATEIPFFDDTSTLKIHADLTRKIQAADESGDNSGDGSPPLKAQLIQAALFLQIAQDYDCHHDGIGQDLSACAGMEKALFDALKGDEDPLFQELVTEPLPGLDETGHRMLPERLAAWARLFLHDSSHAGEKAPLVFLTDSADFWGHILETAPEGTELISLSHRETADRPIPEILADLARTPNVASAVQPYHTPGETEAVMLKAAIIPNQAPGTFITRCADLSPAELANPATGQQLNTVVVLVAS